LRGTSEHDGPAEFLAGGFLIRYARDLRPLAAIPLDATYASLHRPLRGTPRCVIPLARLPSVLVMGPCFP